MRPLATHNRVSRATQTREGKDIATGAAEDKKCFGTYTKYSFELTLGLGGKSIAAVSNGVIKIC